ncbi:uncharacterized protein CLUP02_07009 [Colletotrichum lupini]|uniref:Uncharacterized protein n=1 Tax=Colletotrichum lupini TaxID=145971 RepID=A0A9Q8SQD6_9PEZI|nr:uncharacterized protein CLUP02_07009 [Colletotrichum lupini]UQC81523.1 hypothetical protein CLUP02_07009 [Colletotrichum lupini]
MDGFAWSFTPVSCPLVFVSQGNIQVLERLSQVTVVASVASRDTEERRHVRCMKNAARDNSTTVTHLFAAIPVSSGGD